MRRTIGMGLAARALAATAAGSGLASAQDGPDVLTLTPVEQQCASADAGARGTATLRQASPTRTRAVITLLR